FRHALERGVTGLETDAWLSGDGLVVLVHDGWVWGRVLGVIPRRRAVGATPAADLGQLGVPRLAELYGTLGADFELSVDLKAHGVSSHVVDAARTAGAAGRLWLCAPSVRRLRALRANAPDVRLV